MLYLTSSDLPSCISGPERLSPSICSRSLLVRIFTLLTWDNNDGVVVEGIYAAALKRTSES
jgi:hypothetical protein